VAVVSWMRSTFKGGGRAAFSRGRVLSKQYGVRHIILGTVPGRVSLRRNQGIFPLFAVSIVDEHLTTEEARRHTGRSKNPGLATIFTTTMQVPPEPYDDYVAVILHAFSKKGNGVNS